MKTITLLFVLNVLVTASPFTARAAQSVGYKLWDSNNGLTATLTPSDLGSVQVNHIQIKFDDRISIQADAETLASQFIINMAANRTVNFAVNALDATLLDITLAGDGTAQASSVITIKAAAENGLIPGITDSEGQAVTLVPISSIQPTGLALEVVSATTGALTTPASVTYRMSSIPLVRSMNFLQAQSNKSENPNGYLAREYFTIHSHNYSAMTALTHLTTLTGATNVDTLQKTGYAFELIPVAEDADNPHIKLTALTPLEGEELSWIVYHYPYRAAADRKFELAEAIESSQAGQSVIDAATAVLYDTEATAAEVAAAIRALNYHPTGISLPEMAPNWLAFGGNKAILLRHITPGSIVTVYQINGRIAATVSAKSDTETIAVPTAGIYIVRVNNDKATKVYVR
ncbi:MAG: DUF6383 domain-containing protein [Tannerellaceae bacterium]|jgi:hypothetical protein|nr:DUF6383 domain-containing protein [Tannerellaceae bacterium]